MYPRLFKRSASKVGQPIYSPLSDTIKDGQLVVPLDCITSVIEISPEQTVIGLRNRASLGFQGYISFNGKASIADNVDGSEPFPIEESAAGRRSQAGYLKSSLERRMSVGENANVFISEKDMSQKGAGVTLHIQQAEPEVDPVYGFQRLNFEGLKHLIETAQMSGVHPRGLWVREGTADPFSREMTRRHTGVDSFDVPRQG